MDVETYTTIEYWGSKGEVLLTSVTERPLEILVNVEVSEEPEIIMNDMTITVSNDE